MSQDIGDDQRSWRGPRGAVANASHSGRGSGDLLEASSPVDEVQQAVGPLSIVLAIRATRMDFSPNEMSLAVGPAPKAPNTSAAIRLPSMLKSWATVFASPYRVRRRLV